MSNVKKYKVIALSVGADSNKILKAGDIVEASAWAEEGRADALVEQGFLEEYTGNVEVATGNELQSEIKGENMGDKATNESEQGLPVTDDTTIKTADKKTAAKK